MPKSVNTDQSKPVLAWKNMRRKFRNKLRAEYVIYADFEAIQHRKNKKKGKTLSYSSHKPCGYCFCVVNYDGDLVDLGYYRGKDAMQKFADAIHETAKHLNLKKREGILPMTPLTREQEIDFDNATACHICEEYFDEIDDSVSPLDPPVRDHDQKTGLYRGAAHRSVKYIL
jgi:hypothetical protein